MSEERGTMKKDPLKYLYDKQVYLQKSFCRLNKKEGMISPAVNEQVSRDIYEKILACALARKYIWDVVRGKKGNKRDFSSKKVQYYLKKALHL